MFLWYHKVLLFVLTIDVLSDGSRDPNLLLCMAIPVDLLPPFELPIPIDDASLPSFPKIDAVNLAAFVDAAHATDLLQHKFVTGMVFPLAGGTIADKSKL